MPAPVVASPPVAISSGNRLPANCCGCPLPFSFARGYRRLHSGEPETRPLGRPVGSPVADLGALPAEPCRA